MKGGRFNHMGNNQDTNHHEPTMKRDIARHLLYKPQLWCQTRHILLSLLLHISVPSLSTMMLLSLSLFRSPAPCYRWTRVGAARVSTILPTPTSVRFLSTQVWKAPLIECSALVSAVGQREVGCRSFPPLYYANPVARHIDLSLVFAVWILRICPLLA
jgi:hypothetical protein